MDVSELDDLKARAAERKKNGYWPSDEVYEAEDDLDRAIAIAEAYAHLVDDGVHEFVASQMTMMQERNEARARVAWYERGDQAEVDGYNAAEDGVQKEANPYSKPQQLDDDRRYYDWLDGWERGNTEQELEKARAAALALRVRVKLMPQNSYVKEVLADTEWLEQHRQEEKDA